MSNEAAEPGAGPGIETEKEVGNGVTTVRTVRVYIGERGYSEMDSDTQQKLPMGLRAKKYVSNSRPLWPPRTS